MLTPAELRAAVEQLDRLLRLVDAEVVTSTSAERAYLAGSRDTLAAVLRPHPDLERPDDRAAATRPDTTTTFIAEQHRSAR